MTDGAYIGQYTGDAAPANVSFTEDQFDTVFEDGVYHAAMGTNMKAAGYRFGGWKVSRSRYDGGQTLIVDYTDTSQSTFSIPKSNFTEADDGELTATAIWTPYFAVKYDNNTPTDDVTGMPERTDLTGSYSGTKVFDATNPTRDHYHFRGWSYLSGDNLNAVISHNSSPNDLRPHIPVTAFSNVQGSTNTVEAKYTEDDQGYFELTVYAVWEPMTVYTLTYDLNLAAIKAEGYYTGEEGEIIHRGEYIENSGKLSNWSVSYDEQEVAAFEGDNVTMEMGSGFAAKGYRFGGWQLSYSRNGSPMEPSNYRFTDVNAATFGVYKGRITEADDHQLKLKAIWTPYFAVKFDKNTADDDVTGMPGRTDLTGSYSGTKVFDASNPTRANYYFRGWSYQSGDNMNAVIVHNSSTNDLRPHIPVSAFDNVGNNQNTVEAKYTEDDKGYFELTVYAVWEPKSHYTVYYDKNLAGLDNSPWVGEYLGADNQELTSLPVDSDSGRWYDFVFEEGMNDQLVEGYFPLKHTRLLATGYKFVGWNMYYYRKANNEEGKRLSGPYKYRINNQDGFSSNYGIYSSWFNANDCVDREFILYAVWEPQYQVRYNKGTTETVSNMPEDSDFYPSSSLRNENSTKVFRASVPERQGYYFVGWSTRADCDVDTHPEDLNDVLHRNYIGPQVPRKAFTHPEYDLTKDGYFYAQLYAVWSEHEVYSLYFSEDADEEKYPGIEYLGEMTGHELENWTVVLTHDQVAAIPGKYYQLDRNARLKAKGYRFTGWDLTYIRSNGSEAHHSYRLSQGDYGIYKNWIKESECPDRQFFLAAHWEPQYQAVFHDGDEVFDTSSLVQADKFRGNSKVFKLSSVPSKENKYFVGWSTVPDYSFEESGKSGLLRGTRSVIVPKTAFTASDYNDADQGFLRADLYAIYSDTPIYHIIYDVNTDIDDKCLERDPFIGEYLEAKDPDMVWYELLTQSQLDNIKNTNTVSPSHYPLHRGNLTAKGYVFTGWKLYYTRASGRESTKEYPITLSDSSFSIYGTWFNDTADYEFLLLAQWKPQFAVKLFPNGDNVTNMPNYEYTPLKAEGLFSGNPATAVFAASVPKRENYYFAGWSTEPDYNVDTEGLGGLLHRNSIGPAVPKDSFVNALYSDADSYNYKGFLCSYVYAIWSPHPVYHVFYDPNKEALDGGEYLSDSMNDTWEYSYLETPFHELLTENGGYYPLQKGDLTAKGYVYTGCTLHRVKANGEAAEKVYNVDQYNTSTGFKVPRSTMEDTSDYQFRLVANWEPRYSVMFHENAGSDTVTNMPTKNPSDLFKASDFNLEGKTKIFNDKGENTSKPPQREEFVFLGWSTVKDATPAASLLTQTGSGVHVALSDCVDPVENSFRADLYAVWSRGYTVSYELTGDTPAGVSSLPDEEDYEVGKTGIAVAPDMTAPGYSFSGWNVKTAPEGFAVDDASNTFTMPEGDVVFEGSFIPQDYMVNYYRNKNAEDNEILRTVTFRITDVTDGNIPLDKTVPAAFDTMHEFRHWSASRSGDEVQRIAFDADTSVYSVYANWREVFKAVYNLNGHGSAADKPDDGKWYDSDFEQNTNCATVDTSKVPSAEGYTFKGWKRGSTGGTPDYAYPWQSEQSKVIPKSAFGSSDNTVTLYAIWEQNSHKVIYYREDKSTIIDESTHAVGTQITVGEGVTAPGKEGHTFKEWALKKAPDGFTLSGSQFDMPDGNVEFYATYKVNSYDVIYMVGETQHDNKTYEYGTEVTKGSGVTEPTKENAVFKGWKYVSGLSSEAAITNGIFTMPAETVVFKAEFEDTYQVSYTAKKDGENYTLPAAYQPERFAKDKEVTVKDDLPDIEGYTFSGWQIQSPEGLEISNGTFTMPQNDVVLFGEYTKNSYNVIYEAYDVDGNEISLDPAVYGDAEYFNGDEVTVAPVLTDEEYTFDGWKVKSPANLAVIQSAGGEKTFTMPESNVVLTGRFIDPTAEVVYTITYRSGVNEGDDGYTEDLGKAPEFDVTADADGNATHKVLANNAPELKYVREGYTFAGWKLTKAQPDPNPAPGGKGTVVAPRAYAPNGLIGGGEVITVDSSVVLTAQWTKNVPSPDGEKTPGTGESSVPIVIAFNLAIISLLATGVILRRRRAS